MPTLRAIATSKVTALVLALVGVLGIAAVKVLATSWDLEDLRPALETELTHRLGRAVRIGGLRGSLWRTVTLTDVAISNTKDGFEQGAMATASRVTAVYRGRSILDGDVGALGGIESIDVNGLQAEVIRRPDGSWNFSDLIKPRKRPPTDRFRGTIRVSGATVRYRDALVRVDGRPLDVRPTGLEGEADFSDPLRVAVRASLRGGSEPVDALSVEGLIGSDGSFATGDLEASGADAPYVLSLLPISEDVLSAQEGRANLSARIGFRKGSALSYSVRAYIAGGEFRLPSHLRAPLHYDGFLTATDGGVWVENAMVAYGRSRGRVTGSLLGLADGELVYDADLREAELDLDALLSEWPLLPDGYDLDVAGTVSGAFQVSGSATEMVVTGTASIPSGTLRAPGGSVVRTPGMNVAAEISDPEGARGRASTDEAPVELALPSLFAAPKGLRVSDTGLLIRGDVAARVTFAPGDARVALSLREGSGRFLETDLADVRAEAELSRSGLRLSKFSALADDAVVDGEASVVFGEDGATVAASGLVEGFDLARLERYVDVQGHAVSGKAAARFTLDAGPHLAHPVCLLKGRAENARWDDVSVEHATYAIHFEGDAIDVKSVEATDPRGAAVGHVRLRLPAEAGAPIRFEEGRVRATALDVAAIAPYLADWGGREPPVSGVADLDASFEGPADALSASGRVQVLAPVYDRWSADSIQAELTSAPNEVVFTDLRVRRGGAALAANGVLSGYRQGDGGEASPRIQATATVERLSARDLVGMLEVEDPYGVSGLLYGEVALEGAFDDLAGGGRLELRDGVVAEWPVRAASAEVAFAGSDLEIGMAEFEVDEGGVLVSGVVHDWLNTRSLELGWQAHGLTLDPSVQNWAARYGLRGTVALHGTVIGPPEDFDASLILSSDDLEAAGQRFTRAEAEAHARRYSAEGLTLVEFAPVYLEGAGGLAKIAGFWDSRSKAVNATIDAAGMRFASLARMLEDLSDDPAAVAPLLRAADELGGELHGRIELDGPPGALWVRLEGGRLTDASYRGESLPELSLVAEWNQATQAVLAPEVSLLLDGGSISGALSARLGEGGALEGRLDGQALPLDRLARLLGERDALSGGRVSFRLLASGPNDSPEIRGSIEASDVELSLAGREDGSRTPLRIDALLVDGLVVREGALEAATASVGLGGPGSGLSATDVRIPFSWNPVGVAQDGELRGTVSLPRQELASFGLFPELLEAYGVAGSIEASVLLSGTPRHPALSGRVLLEDGRARIAPTDEIASRALAGESLDIEDVRLALDLSPGSGGELGRVVLSDLRGRALDGAFSGSGAISLVSLSPLDARNRFDLTLEAVGMTHRLFPGPDGVAVLDHAAITVGHSPDSEVNTLSLDDLLVRLGKGRISAMGAVDLDPERGADELGLNRWDAECRIEGLPLNAKDIGSYLLRTFGDDASASMVDVGSGCLDGALTLKSPGDRGGRPVVLGGELVLRDAQLRMPLALPGGSGGPVWSLDRTDVQLATRIRMGDNVFLPQLNAPLRGGARVLGDLRTPRVVGELRGDGGEIAVLGKTWTLHNLGIAFEYAVSPVTRELTLTATLDIEAETRIAHHGQYVRVQLSLHGPLGTTAIRLTSYPALPQEELISLIGSGGGGEGEGAESTLDSLRDDLGTALEGYVTEKAIDTLLDQIRKALGLEKLELDISEDAAVRGFDVEAEVARNLFLRIRQSLKDDESRRELLFGARYKLPGKGSANFSITNYGELQATLEAQWRF